ncbi:MAG: PQQ-binding-like beta-propeller repeat protein, partial [Thermotogae bacterium]|nr:PQQ-binding-like beta-propeller repeat protein [Thermotogota bacterium]
MEKTLFSVIILILVLLLLVPSGCLAMRSQPGILKWKYKTGYWVYSSPVIGEDGTVYVGCDDHYLYAIRPDGILKWKYKTG